MALQLRKETEMSKQIEAMKMALEALKANNLLVNGDDEKGGLAWCMDGYYSGCFNIESVNKQTDDAINALSQAIEESHGITGETK
jgi:type II secretory pathway component PulK